MPDFLSPVVRQIGTAVAIFTAVLAGASERDITSFLPGYSAIAAGVDLCALGAHWQGAGIYDHLQSLCDVPLDALQRAAFACDRGLRRCVVAVSFNDAGKNAKLFRMLSQRKSTESIDSRPVYFLRGAPGDRKAVRLLQLDELHFGLYCKFPSGRVFAVDQRGIPPELAAVLPRRSGTIMWIGGVPVSHQKYLREVVSFDAALESGIDDQLFLHGKIVCKDASTAAMAQFFLPNAVAMLLFRRADIPMADTIGAFAALNMQHRGNILYFSCTDFLPVIRIFMQVIKGKIPSIRKMTDEKAS